MAQVGNQEIIKRNGIKGGYLNTITTAPVSWMLLGFPLPSPCVLRLSAVSVSSLPGNELQLSLFLFLLLLLCVQLLLRAVLYPATPATPGPSLLILQGLLRSEALPAPLSSLVLSLTPGTCPLSRPPCLSQSGSILPGWEPLLVGGLYAWLGLKDGQERT